MPSSAIATGVKEVEPVLVFPADKPTVAFVVIVRLVDGAFEAASADFAVSELACTATAAVDGDTVATAATIVPWLMLIGTALETLAVAESEAVCAPVALVLMLSDATTADDAAARSRGLNIR